MFKKILQAKSKRQGLVDGCLARCPSSPNSVLSEQHATAQQFIKPFEYEGQQQAWPVMQKVLADLGAELKESNDEYLWAEFTTPLMGYVDDVEMRHDKANHCIHVRSISRLGYSDLGANRKRVEKLRTVFNHYLEADFS